MNGFIITISAIGILIAICLILTSRTSSVVGRTLDNLFRLSILLEHEKYTGAGFALKMMRYQFIRLDDKNISYDQFILIAKRVRPNYKVKIALDLIYLVLNDPSFNSIFDSSAYINTPNKSMLDILELLDSYIELRKLISKSSTSLVGSSLEKTDADLEKMDNAIQNVERYLGEMGYQLTPYGIGLVFLELVSGYSEAEIASHIALTTLALDVKEAGKDIMKYIFFVSHAKVLLSIIRVFKEQGLMRDVLWQNDSIAIWHVVNIDKDQNEWIEKILNDPTLPRNERVAYSTINYSQDLDEDP